MKKGFTLIELLVVITIIGILATGAVTTFTSQIQKARDATRISSVKALQGAIEQVYQDKAEYPNADEFIVGDTSISNYVENLPSDPKHGQPCNNDGSGDVDCGYAYATTTDANGIEYGTYEISTAFENSGNREAKAENDSGSDDLRQEFGSNLAAISTVVDEDDITEQVGACQPDGSDPGSGTDLIIINGNAAGSDNCG